MRHSFRLLGLICAGALSLPLVAQLTPDQMLFDFNDLAAIYAKRYGPYDWKKTLFGYDLLNLQPWTDQISTTTNDLDFYEVMVRYVASLHDTHDAYSTPSNFTASVGLNVDIYDGKVIIDGINRSFLPAATFPVQVGDQLLSVDGTDVTDLLAQNAVYAMEANDRSTLRQTANTTLVNRSQSRMPHAPMIGDTATLVIQRQNGNVETYTVAWHTSGVPLYQIGPVPSPQSLPAKRVAAAMPGQAPPYDPQSLPLGGLEISQAPEPMGILNFASITPIFTLPSGFQQRLGKNSSTDFFYSGTFTSNGYTIGYIRIPTYNPSNTSTALSQFQTEIQYMEANTDGLIVDEMRNNGGLLCYGEAIVSYLMPTPYQPLGYEIRATWEYVQLFGARLASAMITGPQSLIDQYQMLYDATMNAYMSTRGRTDAVPICGPTFTSSPANDGRGNVLAYTKPMIMLIDEYSLSTADSVPAMFQDNQRGPLVGMRSMGAGGSNSLNISSWQVGAYSEGSAGVTLSLMHRKNPVTVDGYPTTSYIENVGVQPDYMVDFMTLDNLLHGGKTFVNAFTNIMVQQIQSAQSTALGVPPQRR
ncbi:MAG TPA: S41 family peptidase [Bryobacteraceae bacterium]|nr:S41 family peptidase [Bryobacteraceae bacterium]